MPKEITIKVIVGEKISQEEAKQLDQAQRGIAIVGKPPETDVEGQTIKWDYVRCPWCGAFQKVYWPHPQKWFHCAYCSYPVNPQRYLE